MNVLLVSQCNKRALVETRRVLDQFAERKGDRTWQTTITLDGLNTVKKLLRKTARRNTAVICHWLKKSGQTEVLWIVGKISAFDDQGTVPTNRTSRNVLRNQDESGWQVVEAIALAAAIAGLFHDFGKANQLFQLKLVGKSGATYEPHRHEWVSLRLFQAFVQGLPDSGWLQKLTEVPPGEEADLLKRLQRDGLGNSSFAPLAELQGFARLVGWLIVSHHKLPLYPNDGESGPALEHIDDWLVAVGPEWNSPQCREADPAIVEQNWQFPHGTPLSSRTWQKKAKEVAQRALRSNIDWTQDWQRQRFASHLARLSLMLADHYYSALTPDESVRRWRDEDLALYANTDRTSKKPALKQKLDEHNIGVGQNALLFARNLPQLRTNLAAITRHPKFSQRSAKGRFKWQNKAYDVATALREPSRAQGFFGVNMASTGCGKTFANARIRYGLADSRIGCRFSIALGLRTLTLQTGDALRSLLNLSNNDLAVVVGSQAVRDLHALRTGQAGDALEQSIAAKAGSASAAELAEHLYVSYEGSIRDKRLARWLEGSPNLARLIDAPILVSTIDHLIPATDGVRGGKQIAPMLRLLSSDLVLDEPDDFDLDDLPALCRLVNWAGMLGSRVLLSSATLPPVLVAALFDAYQSGRVEYNRATGTTGRDPGVLCAWFDEFRAEQGCFEKLAAFNDSHTAFVKRRIDQLARDRLPLRKGCLAPIAVSEPGTEIERKLAAIASMAEVIHEQSHSLHAKHCQQHESGKRFSLGVVRMANIKPLVALARQLFNMKPKPDTRIHYCVYHSQHPLAVRSYIEQKLDLALTRYDPQAFWWQPEVRRTLTQCAERNQIFVVLATSVAEVGRDHDYDWAIAEPSSMRSIIQLAGRIQRHRQHPPSEPNLVILQRNFKALCGKTPAYLHPGFETDGYPLKSHDLTEILRESDYRDITAISRIEQPKLLKAALTPMASAETLVEQEHRMLRIRLLPIRDQRQLNAALWWRHEVTWLAELVKEMPFRKSARQDTIYCCWDGNGDPEFTERDDQVRPVVYKPSNLVAPQDCTLVPGNQAWFDTSVANVFAHYADGLACDVEDIGPKYGEVRLTRYSDDRLWHWHPLLGVYEPLG